MEGEGEANMTEEGAEPRGGRGAEVVDDKAELGADRGHEVGAEWRRKVVGRKAGSEAMSARGGEITPGLAGRSSWLWTPIERSREAAVAETRLV